MKFTGKYYVFFSPKLTKVDKHNLDQYKVEEEEERSKAVLLLKLSDEGKYKSRFNSVKEGAFLDRDEYSTTVATMYTSMIRHS